MEPQVNPPPNAAKINLYRLFLVVIHNRVIVSGNVADVVFPYLWMFIITFSGSKDLFYLQWLQ